MQITSAAVPSMRSPVAGESGGAMQSFYGDPRDGGRRRHEGVDIFGPRGTPVIAASSGLVTKVGQGRLSGRVVWIRDLARGVRVCYARLQEQSDQSVRSFAREIRSVSSRMWETRERLHHICTLPFMRRAGERSIRPICPPDDMGG